MSKIQLFEGDIGGTYELVFLDKKGRETDKPSVLIQSDWDFPDVASSFGWTPCKKCRETDGTVDCAHKTATQMISEAADFLDQHIGKKIEDPGYFYKNNPKVHQLGVKKLGSIWRGDEDGEYIQINDAGAFSIAHGCVTEVISHREYDFEVIRAWMEKHGFYPNIWHVNERGNVNLYDANGNSLGGLV